MVDQFSTYVLPFHRTGCLRTILFQAILPAIHLQAIQHQHGSGQAHLQCIPTYSHPLGDITNLNGSSSGSVTSPNKNVVDPFMIQCLNRRTKVCAGCKSAHPKDPGDENLPPPNDLCILHKQSISFTNPKTGKEASSLVPRPSSKEERRVW